MSHEHHKVPVGQMVEVGVAAGYPFKFEVERGKPPETMIILANGSSVEETNCALQKCRLFASSLRLRLVGEFIRSDFGLVHPDGSDALIAALKMAKDTRVDVIITTEITQLSTHPQVIMDFLQELSLMKIRLAYPDLYIGTAEQMLSCPLPLAQHRNGPNFRYAYAPFGYRRKKDSNDIEIHPEHAQVVYGLFSSIAGGHSINSICRELNDNGVLFPLRSRSCQVDAFRPWINNRVTGIVRNALYKGEQTIQSRGTNPETTLPCFIKREDLRIVHSTLWNSTNDTILAMPASIRRRKGVEKRRLAESSKIH